MCKNKESASFTNGKSKKIPWPSCAAATASAAAWGTSGWGATSKTASPVCRIARGRPNGIPIRRRRPPKSAFWRCAKHGRWGPTTLKAVLERKDAAAKWPARSTIGNFLRRQGLSVPRRRRPRAAPTPPPLTPMKDPNQVWSIDFKGWFRTQDGERCDPLTICDGTSRYLLCCQAMLHPDGAHVRPRMEATFREYGLPQVMRSDNGPPFATVAVHGLSALAVWWIKLGIYPERIEPGHPEQNGRHERMHRTLKEETAAAPERTMRAQQRAFDRFQQEYNEERPHQGLELKTPAECYAASPREYPSRIEEPEYPAGYEVRRVSKGEIRWRVRKMFIGNGNINGFRPCREAGSRSGVRVTSANRQRGKASGQWQPAHRYSWRDSQRAASFRDGSTSPGP